MLIAQLTQFAIDKGVSVDDWSLVTTSNTKVCGRFHTIYRTKGVFEVFGTKGVFEEFGTKGVLESFPVTAVLDGSVALRTVPALLSHIVKKL